MIPSLAYFTEWFGVELGSRICEAVWAGDTDTLWEIAPCRCCCNEHTCGWGCPAYAWGGCRGQGMAEFEEDVEVWAKHYERFRGMSRDEFFG